MAAEKLTCGLADDAELMQGIARGDISDLEKLYLRHKDRAVTMAYRVLGQWSLAEDVSQEAFLRVYKAAEKYKTETEFTTWLYKIVVNLCIDEKRRIKRSRNFVSTYESLSARQKNNQNSIAEVNTEDVVKKAIQKLSQRQQTVVILHRLEGLSHEEINNKTGWSISSIESLLVRAYRNLRKELSTSLNLNSYKKKVRK
ncbi:MAG: RNA polymerase sigma factor [Anaerohalosphaera sp.]|nr:RNA polymerase sigma factor [Anaerohalosphaera sp.]